MTTLAHSPELHRAPVDTQPSPRHLGEAAVRIGRHRAPESGLGIETRAPEQNATAHRRTLGHEAYIAAQQTGNKDLIDTAHYLVRREQAGDPAAAQDIKTFMSLVDVPPAIEHDPKVVSLALYKQERAMPDHERPTIKEISEARDSTTYSLTDALLEPEDFYVQPHHTHVPGTRDINLPTDQHPGLNNPTSNH